MIALLALPFSGGAFTLTLRVFSSQPAIQSFDDEGITLICSFIKVSAAQDSSTRCQFPSSRVTSYLAHLENSFFVITLELRLLLPAMIL